MQLTKECMTRLMALKTAGRRLQYQKAMTVLGEAGLGAKVTQAFRPESRIPNCHKHDLGDGYRIVLQAIEGAGEYLALFVGTHDEVEHFLNTHQGWIFDPRKHTLKELRLGTVAEEQVNTPRSADLSTPARGTGVEPLPPVFERLGREQLVRAGVPEDAVDEALAFTDPNHPSVLAYLERLGERASGLLLAYLTGSKGERDEIEALLSGDRVLVPSVTTEHLPALKESSEEFVDLHDLPEDKKAFESLPFEDWMLYLHPDQLPLVARRFSGPARLRGISGSGKTVVAIHRARALGAELMREGREGQVLFLTFNRSLCDLVNALIQRLCTEEEAERIQVSTMGKWCQGYIRFHTDHPATWSEEANERLWLEVLRAQMPQLLQVGFFLGIAPDTFDITRHRDTQFLRDELDYVFERFLHEETPSYRTQERVGRGRPLGANQREAVLSLYHALVNAHAQSHQFDPRDLARAAYGLLRAGKPPEHTYAAIIVDEVQDLSRMELRVVKCLGGATGEGLFLVGDGAQRIYGRGQSLRSIGIDIVGRSAILRKNYRNTREIFAAAVALKKAQQVGRSDDDPAAIEVDPIPSSSSGDRPLLMIARDPDQEWGTIVKEVGYLTKRLGLRPSQICCVARMDWMRRGLIEGFENAGIKAVDFRVESDPLCDSVVVSTLHNSKGQEFRAVFIAGLHDDAVPYGAALNDSDQMEREAALLYVAMTRAKELLYLSYSKKDDRGKDLHPSRFLAAMKPYLDSLELA